MLVAALGEPEPESDFSSPQLLEQLREIGDRAAQELDQFAVKDV